MKALIVIWILLPVVYSLSGCFDNVPLETQNQIAINTSINNDNTKIVRFSSNTPTTDDIAQWNFGDGFTGHGNPIRHEYQHPGRYTVTLHLQTKNQTHIIEKQLVISGESAKLMVASTGAITIDSDTNDPHILFVSNNITPQKINTPTSVSGILMATNACQAGRLCKDGDTIDQFLLPLNYGQQLDLTVLEGALNIQLIDPKGYTVISKLDVQTPLTIDKNQLGHGDYLLSLSLPYSTAQAQYTFSISEQFDSGLYQPGKLIVTWEHQSNPELVDLQDPRLRPVLNQGIHAARTYLSRQKNVQSVSLNYLRFPSGTSNYFPAWQWPLQLQKIHTLWRPLELRGQKPGENVRIAILDTGLYLAHENLSQMNVEDGFDFVSDPINSQDGDGWDANPDDPGDAQRSYHGSHVTGIIAAQPLPQIEKVQSLLGIAWGATIMPIRVLGQYGGTSYDLIQAMRYAAGLENDSQRKPKKPADIINLSLGGASFSAVEQATISEIINSGSIIVAAAGNDGIGQVEYPARYQHVISVGAFGQTQSLSNYSNYGLHLDLLAPGGECSDANCSGGITSLSANGALTGGYDTRSASLRTLSGTSMASAHVSALIAIMRSYLPALDSRSLLSLIRSGQLTQNWGVEGFDKYTGWGSLDSEKILTVMETSALNTTGLWTSHPDLHLEADSISSIPLIFRGQDTAPITIEYDQSQLAVTSSETAIQIQTLNNFNQSQNIQIKEAGISKLNITVSPKINHSDNHTLPEHLYVTHVSNNQPIARAVNQNGSWTAQLSNSELINSIQVSTDIDYDGIYCEPGEFCAFSDSINATGTKFLEGSLLQN